MDTLLKWHLVLFGFAVCGCVAWTKLLYLDGLYQRLERLKRHCLMHAGMIVTVSAWAMSIGFYVHHESLKTIHEQQHLIQHLATQRTESTGENNVGMGHQIANVVAPEINGGGQPAEIITPAGNRILVGYTDRPVFRDSECDRRDAGEDRPEQSRWEVIAGPSWRAVRSLDAVQELSSRADVER